jgi:hypothetical protein
MTEIEQLVERKNKLNSERDLCCELYNLWLTRLHENENTNQYDLYVKLIRDLEEYSQIVKTEVTDINKRICEIEGVNSIEETEYTHECRNKYGLDQPNK